MDIGNNIDKLRNAFFPWSFDYEDGIVMFHHNSKPLVVYGTPHWDGHEGIPIDVSDEYGDEVIPSYGVDFDDTVDGYIEVMKGVLNDVASLEVSN